MLVFSKQEQEPLELTKMFPFQTTVIVFLPTFDATIVAVSAITRQTALSVFHVKQRRHGLTKTLTCFLVNTKKPSSLLHQLVMPTLFRLLHLHTFLTRLMM